MNQLVAPTSFITETSRRRAKIAMRIVLRISTRRREQQHRGQGQEDDLQDPDGAVHLADLLLGRGDAVDAGLVRER